MQQDPFDRPLVACGRDQSLPDVKVFSRLVKDVLGSNLLNSFLQKSSPRRRFIADIDKMIAEPGVGPEHTLDWP
ncbi:MAG: hypothetical protein MZV65_22295 [Chromatiales bacterium]|nr:hypothetical protein [Chromatiales bacterium]